ncbi:MAG: hypothetical protein KKA73_13765 [Chloroflexi bacterium]|nr:hypothetical protein [Chloroflexota bacterium]
MDTSDIGQEWTALCNEVLTGMREWHGQHPTATLNEIEATLDDRLSRLRAKMLQDLALASRATQWKEQVREHWPVCPHCQEPLGSRGQQDRHLQTHGGREVVLERSYGVCPTCGTGFFPPG